MAEAAEKHGTQTAPSRRLRRAAVAVLAVVPLLGSALPASSATASPVSTRAATSSTAPAAVTAPDDNRTADISVNKLTPAVPDADDTLTLSGTVTNTSDQVITAGEVSLRVGPAVKSRSAIDAASRRTGFEPGVDAPALDGHKASIEKLAPGITRPFTLKVPVRDLGLKSSGVYQVGVSYSGHTPSRSYERVLAIERTFLPWQTSAVKNTTQLTFLWPLISSPHLTARTESDERQTPIFRSDDLEQAIRSGGRLQQMVALGDDLPVTWVVDPDLLASVVAMTEDYKVRTDDGKTVDGQGQGQARQWLHDLLKAVEDDEVVALPFADPDLASLAHRGKEVPGALARLRSATGLATRTVENILHTTPNTDFAWPVEGAVDTSVVDVATSAGADHVIADSNSFSDTRNLPYTPNAARPVMGGVTAVVADHGLSTAFQGDLTDAGAAVAARQEFVAHTLSLTRQVPGLQRNILVAPQRQPTVSQAQAMADGIRAVIENGGWAESAELSETARADADPDADRSVPGPGAYPDRLRKDELPTEAFRQIHQTQVTLEDFAEVLAEPDRLKSPIGTAIDRAMSTSWRESSEDAGDYRSSVQDYLVGLTRQVQLIDKSELTLSGRSATIPVTVQNRLAQGVEGLTLRLTSSRSIGLRIDDEMQPVVVDGGHSQSIKFATTAKANGRTKITAQLYTADGQKYGAPVQFDVKVTSITSTVLLVIAAGVGLVVLAGIRMYTQRKRNGPQPDPDAPLEPSPSEEPSQDGDAHGPRGRDDEDTDAAQDTAHSRASAAEDAGESGKDAGEGGKGAGEDGEKTDGPRDTGGEDGDEHGTGEKVDR